MRGKGVEGGHEEVGDATGDGVCYYPCITAGSNYITFYYSNCILSTTTIRTTLSSYWSLSHLIDLYLIIDGTNPI
jgi:hypothetical protein